MKTSVEINADIVDAKQTIQKRGGMIDEETKEIDVSRFAVVGINTLGKLDFLNRNGYTVFLPVLNENPNDGYTGLGHPFAKFSRTDRVKRMKNYEAMFI